MNHYGNGAQYIGGPREAEVLVRYQQIKADTEAHAHLGGGSGTGQLTFTTDASNHYLGEMTVTTSPSNDLGTVTLTNGVFADTGSPIRNGVRHGDVYPVLGVAPQDGSSYRISAVGAFTAQGNPTYGADVRLHSDANQRTAGPGTRTPGVVNFSVQGQDGLARTSTFQPIVGTQVASQFVAQGETLRDILTFSTAPNASGVNNPWRQDEADQYVPITAQGTIYGPFLAQPLESDEVPANAPVAASGIKMTTSIDEGPTIDYTVESNFSPTEAGFYTWVWQIRAEDQAEHPDSARAFLPGAYSFTDRFGQVAETTISPTKLAITTQLSKAEIGIGQEITDEVAVAVYGGGWLQHEGQRVPATLTGTAYYSETEPELAEHAPDDAEAIGELQLTFDNTGVLDSGPLTMPLRAGYVTFQWCLRETHQPEALRGLLAETCDKYGQTSETVRLVEPTVTTLATQKATLEEPIFDTAVIDGEVPIDTSIEFALYERLETHETPQCSEENLVKITDRVAVEPGFNDLAHYPSPEVTVERNGTYWWVESLIHEDLLTGEQTVISSGECGIKNETTTVADEPPVSPPPTELAATGVSDASTPWQWGALLGLSGITTLALAAWLRRRVHM